MTRDDVKEIIRETIKEVFCSPEESIPINRLHDKIDELIVIQGSEDRVEIATKTLDKFDDYMKNFDKLNQMINEFKGLVSIVRGEARVVRDENQNLKKQLRKLLGMLSE